MFLINSLPTPTLNKKSPFECLFHKATDYASLRVVGCTCYPFLRPYNNYKLQFRTSKCLFLGYNPAHKGYRCLHLLGRIYIAKTVHFNEYKYPYISLFSSPTNQNSARLINPKSILVDHHFFVNNLPYLNSSLPL